MVYEYDGVLHLLARTNLGYYAKTDSFDGGKTFPYELVLDDGANLSYPDLDEDDKGNLYVVYDRERNNFIRLNKPVCPTPRKKYKFRRDGKRYRKRNSFKNVLE